MGKTAADHVSDFEKKKMKKKTHIEWTPRLKDEHLKTVYASKNSSHIKRMHQLELEGYKTEVRVAKDGKVPYKYIYPLDLILHEWAKDIMSPDLAAKAAKAHQVLMEHHGVAQHRVQRKVYHPNKGHHAKNKQHDSSPWGYKIDYGMHNTGDTVFHAIRRFHEPHGKFSTLDEQTLLAHSYWPGHDRIRKNVTGDWSVGEAEYRRMVRNRAKKSSLYHPHTTLTDREKFLQRHYAGEEAKAHKNRMYPKWDLKDKNSRMTTSEILKEK